MNDQADELRRRVRHLWNERRRLQAYTKDGPPKFRRHYLDHVTGRLRSALADLLDVTPPRGWRCV